MFQIPPKDDFEYVYIGDEIYSFSTSVDGPVLDFRAPMGNSGVPYAWAETKNRFYLFLEHVYVNKSDMTDTKLNPYEFYYAYHLIEGLENVKFQAKRIKITEAHQKKVGHGFKIRKLV